MIHFIVTSKKTTDLSDLHIVLAHPNDFLRFNGTRKQMRRNSSPCKAEQSYIAHMYDVMMYTQIDVIIPYLYALAVGRQESVSAAVVSTCFCLGSSISTKRSHTTLLWTWKQDNYIILIVAHTMVINTGYCYNVGQSASSITYRSYSLCFYLVTVCNKSNKSKQIQRVSSA